MFNDGFFIMKKQSAGILIYRFQNGELEVFLVHPGGPLWAHKDEGAWSIPKGEPENQENLLEAAKREVEEETGIGVKGEFMELTPVKQKGGKLVHAWAIQCDIHPENIKSNTFELEWPPKSGEKISFPEIDKASWFGIQEAQMKINIGQSPLLLELMVKVQQKK